MPLSFTGLSVFLSKINSPGSTMRFSGTWLACVGEDGKRYQFAPISVTSSEHYIFNMDDGTAVVHDYADGMDHLYAISGVNFGAGGFNTVFACPGTPYFVAQRSTLHGTGVVEFGMVRYRIDTSGDFVIDGAFVRRFNIGSFYARIGYGVFYPCAANVVEDSLYLAWDNDHYNNEAMLTQLPFSSLDVLEISPAYTDWTGRGGVSDLGQHFYESGFAAGQYDNRGCILSKIVVVDLLPTVVVGSLTLIRQIEIDNTTGNTLIDAASVPFVIWSSAEEGNVDMTADFAVPFSDAQKYYDGSPAPDDTRARNNDYSGPSAFLVDGEWIIAFCRPFTDKSEYVHLILFQWNNGVPTLIHDGNIHFWDAVTDGGVTVANRNIVYNEYVQVGYDPVANKLLLQTSLVGAPGGSFGTFVFAELGAFDDVEGEEGGGDTPGEPASHIASLLTPPSEVTPRPPTEIEDQIFRWLIRTAHQRDWGEVMIDDARITIKRGIGDADSESTIWLRVNRDNQGFGQWIKRSLGKSGENVTTIYFGGLGSANDWQFEFATTDSCVIELRKFEILTTQLWQ